MSATCSLPTAARVRRVGRVLPAALALDLPAALVLALPAALVLVLALPGGAPPVALAADERRSIAGEHELTDAILRLLAARSRDVHALRGRAEVRVSAGTWGGPSWLESVVLAEAPGRLRLRGYAGPATLFDLAADSARYTLFLPDENVAWTGPPESLVEITGFPGRPAQVVEAVLGRPFGTPDSLELLSVDADEVRVRWRRAGGEIVRARFGRDPLVARELALERDGRQVVVLRYDDYRRETPGWWPREVSLAWPDEGARLALTFRQLELNPTLENDAFRFSPPAGAVRIEVGGGPAGGGPGAGR